MQHDPTYVECVAKQEKSRMKRLSPHGKQKNKKTQEWAGKNLKQQVIVLYQSFVSDKVLLWASEPLLWLKNIQLKARVHAFAT